MFRGAEAIAGLEGRPLPLRGQPESEGPAAKAKALAGFGGTGFSTDFRLSVPGATAHAREVSVGPAFSLFPHGNVLLCRINKERCVLFVCIITFIRITTHNYKALSETLSYVIWTKI